MKKLITYLFLILTISACGDDEKEDNPVPTDPLTGTWVIEEHYLSIDGDAKTEKGDGSYYKFDKGTDIERFYKPKPGGGFYEHDTGTYYLEQDINQVTFTFNGYSGPIKWEIKSLTENQFKIHHEGSEKGRYYIEEITMKKQ